MSDVPYDFRPSLSGELTELPPGARVAGAAVITGSTAALAIDAERASRELMTLAANLGVSDAAFQGILDGVRARAEASPDWGRPHEIAAEIRRRLLEVATTP